MRVDIARGALAVARGLLYGRVQRCAWIRLCLSREERMEAAVRAAKGGMRVLIVCPTGTLVHSYKSLLPHGDGIENVSMDTIHGVLKYKRLGSDQTANWATSVIKRYP